MSAADFRHIAFGGGPRNCERLFRASISAFCSLPRPTRAEISQLDDLSLGLFDAVSPEARRFAAAVLSECEFAPPGIVRRLCDEPVEVAAPLLVRSRMLSDIDLIALIARHGVSHARAIARRDELHPVVAALIRALMARLGETTEAAPAFANDAQPQSQTSALEATRDKLRNLMRQSGPSTFQQNARERTAAEVLETYAALRACALVGDTTGVAAHLANVLEVLPPRASRLATQDCPGLLTALAALQLSAEQAFFIAAKLHPAQLANVDTARRLLERYVTTGMDEARRIVANWRIDDRPETGTTIHSIANVK